MKFLKNITFLILLIFFQCVFSEGQNFDIFNIFTINFPKNIKVMKNSEEIDTYHGLMVYLYYNIEFDSNEYNVSIYLNPKKGININQIKNYTKIDLIRDDLYAGFGLGDAFKIMKKNVRDVEVINLNNRKGLKFISKWGSEISKDILVYYFDIYNNIIFDGCIIELINVWPGDTLPENYGLNYINKLIHKSDKKVNFYKLMDDMIQDIKFHDK